MPEISIVLSGGSSKGAYQIGFFKALIKRGLSPYITSASATSIGAINTYAFFSGKLDKAEEIWLDLNINSIWKLRHKISQDLLEQTFSELIKEEDHIYNSFFITLTEMSSMTAEYFNLKGKMNNKKKKLLETTISIPLITTPPLRYRNKIYFDGGVTDNIPISPILKEIKSDIIFIAHFTPDYQIASQKDKTIIDINFSNSNNFIKGNFNFKREHVKFMIDEGERFTLQILDNYFNNTIETPQIKKNIYYYLSGARLLYMLNNLLNIGKKKRIRYIQKVKNHLNRIKRKLQTKSR